jgi:PAS domain S-box-containing protein
MEVDSALELDYLNISEVLDQDSRPTFIIDLDPDVDAPLRADTIRPVFCNSALRSHEKLFDDVVGKPSEQSFKYEENSAYHEFKNWVIGVTTHDDSKDVFPLSFLYSNIFWTGSTVRQRWRFISGNHIWGSGSPLSDQYQDTHIGDLTSSLKVQQDAEKRSSYLESQRWSQSNQPDDNTTLTETATLVSSKDNPGSKTSSHPIMAGGNSDDTGESLQSKTSIILMGPEKAVPDWTVNEPKGILSPHLLFSRTVNWASTPLGPMEKWSPEFRQAANLCMNNPHPSALFWGSDLTMLYNEAYAIEVAGNKHPSLMGTGFSGPFAELWDAVSPIFAECARTGISIRRENDYLPIERHGFLEETFFSWSFTPLYGGTHSILGFYNAPFETTQQVLNNRRMQTINTIGHLSVHVKTVKQFWKSVLNGLEDNHFDVPFALLYSVGESEDDHSSTSSGSTMSLRCCYFEGSIGVPEGHIATPKQLDLKRSREGFVPSFREAMRIREPTLLRTRDGTLPEALLDGINWRGFEEPCHEAIIFPVRPTNGDMVMAFLVLGVNPRRRYDDGYKAFTSMLNRQLATSLASVILFEEEVRRSRDAAEAAALEQEQLTQQLALQTNRLRRMTELSPLGMFLISPEGILREANDRFFEMTGLARESLSEMSWMECIMEGSTKTMDEGWYRLVVEHIPWSGELQLKKQLMSSVNLNGESIDYWVLLTAQPEFASENTLRSITGSITEISHLKWVEGLQNRRLEEAEETRRQQNEFIDITSHEMRNPLSAILQCADDISSTLESYRSQNSLPHPALLESCLDAAQTIALCVQHQKSIVDDILTISKLDSNLLLITPVVAQPVTVAQRVIKMFDPELQAKGVDIVFDIDPSMQELDVEWMVFDPSRVLQILINLMTNAIKFTTGADTRIITVFIGVSFAPPLDTTKSNFQYIPAKTTSVNSILGDEWDPAEVLYLCFQVQDTGCGLTPEEKQVLFERFSQASPRTHAQYGGSGLGLFISRQLAELHGGQIGVASEAGNGSTFGFYIAGRRSDPPRQNVPHESGARAVKLDPKNVDFLVVEDNLVNQKILVNQLRKAGSVVNTANDGTEALAFLEQSHFCKPDGQRLTVILMDLEMPKMDGLTCVRHIRDMEELGKIRKHVPVIAVTANVRDEQIKAAMESGMDDVVSKPFRMIDLFNKIEKLSEVGTMMLG